MCAQLPNAVLESISVIDTPGILSGEKQRISRGEWRSWWAGVSSTSALLASPPSLLCASKEPITLSALDFGVFEIESYEPRVGFEPLIFLSLPLKYCIYRSEPRHPAALSFLCYALYL